MSIHCRILLTVSLLSAFTPFGVTQDGILGTATKSDKTGRVYDLLADYQFASDQFNRQRHCLVATGSRIRHTDNGVMESGINYLAVKESGGDKLIASSIVVPSSTGRLLERWNQRLVKNGKVYLRGSPYTDKEKETFDANDERLRERRDWAVDLRPFAQVLVLPNTLKIGRGPARPAESFLSDNYTLIEADYLDSRDIVASFATEPVSTQAAVNIAQPRITKTITFSKDVDYLPASCSTFVDQGGKKRLIGRGVTHWEKVRKTWVPMSYEGTYFSSSGEEHLYLVKCRFKVGKDMPQGLIDVSLPDWREPIRNLFQVEWQRQGVTPPSFNREEDQ